MNNIKVAIVHDWLVNYSGSEKVLEELLKVFPQADVFTVVDYLTDELRKKLNGKKAYTTFIQKLPFAKNKYRYYLPLMPMAIEQLDVSGYDIVISSSHAVSKGVLSHVNQLHICYCHSPIRYAWDLYHQYIYESGLKKGLKGFIVKLIMHYLRIWDLSTINRIDHFIANSHYIARRINKVYNRSSKVIYPPVEIENFAFSESKENFYVTTSRLVAYKKIDLIAEAFSQMPDKTLYIIGEGPDFKKIKKKCADNVKMLGFQSVDLLVNYMQRAKGFVFAADEDFGITPIEAQACGTPVIAYGKGGNLETVVGGETGVYFYNQTVEDLLEAIRVFERDYHTFEPLKIRKHAEQFNAKRFRENMFEYIMSNYDHIYQEA